MIYVLQESVPVTQLLEGGRSRKPLPKREALCRNYERLRTTTDTHVELREDALDRYVPTVSKLERRNMAASAQLHT